MPDTYDLIVIGAGPGGQAASGTCRPFQTQGDHRREEQAERRRVLLRAVTQCAALRWLSDLNT
jgi:hypothetical protein